MSHNNDNHDYNLNENSSSNNNTKEAEKGEEETIVSASKARRQYKAELELAEFAKLFFIRVSEDEICKMLSISRSTYYRYLTKLGDQQQELLNEHLNASTYAEIASFRNTLHFVERQMKHILLDPNAENADKIAAAEWLCEVAYASVKLHTEGFVKTTKEMPGYLKNKVQEVQQQQQQQQQSLPHLIKINTEEEVMNNDNNSKGKKNEDAATNG